MLRRHLPRDRRVRERDLSGPVREGPVLPGLGGGHGAPAVEYESTDFWSPDLYRKYLAGPLKDEVRTAHQAGVKVTYVMNSGAMPLLPVFREVGFDVLSNIDPRASRTDMPRMKEEIGDRICLCGGVNNTHILEQGSEADVERAVEDAMGVLAPGSGFVLAPGDSVGFASGVDQSIVRRNLAAMIGAWKRVCNA